MFKYLLFFSLFFTLNALEVSLTGAKENFQNYSTLHIKDKTPFLCQEMKNDFKEVTKIVCAFNQKPRAKIKSLQNSFFKIDNQVKSKTFFLIITPFEKIKLYPMVFDMIKDDTLYQSDIKLARHWMVVGYKKELPFIKKEKVVDTSINFPFKLAANNLPYVGGLDIKGNPVHIQRVGDVTEYLKIKKLYKEKKYERCMELIEEIMLDYPNSLFRAELIFYKIQVYSKLEDSDNVIAMSKEFLREYSSDENIPEVLALIGKAYSKIGLNTDADYFFDRLFDEHLNTESAKWGYVYKADMLEESGAASQALQYYKKALNETTQIETAATAAYNIAKHKVTNGDMENGAKYIMKIVKAKPAFFIEDLKTSMDMMYHFADTSNFITAAAIAKSILDATTKEHDEYERLLKDRGIWLSKSEDKVAALNALNEYIQIFPFGDYEDIVEVANDELFFDTNDGNFSQKLEKYNALIEDYENDIIGNRAVYEKAKLLLENEKYTQVLEMEESVLELDAEFYEDKESIVVDSAIGIMKESLENRKCDDVLNISYDYNITLSNEWDDGIYECAMMGGDYSLAKKTTGKNLNLKDLELRKKWLYRHIKADFATGNYSEVLKASKDLITLIEDDKSGIYNEIYRILFDTYQRLEKKEKFLESITQIQKVFKTDYKDMERYVAVMSMGEEKKDDNLVTKYGEEVMKIQNNSSSFAQSPFVEFTLYQAYINKEELEKALAIISSLERVTLSKEDKARQKYLLGNILTKLWRGDEAMQAYNEAIQSDENSPWANLAKTAKENL